MGKRITMQDIANELNISKNSVSQALSGKPGVSDDTRKLVEQTAKRLGYRYTKKTSNADTFGKSGSIALIASDVAFSLKGFFGKIYLSIEKEAARRGMRLFIHSINQDATESLTLPASIEEKQVDGILILSHITTEYINKVLDKGIPTVLIDHHHPFNEADSILTNNRFGAYKAIQHLVDLEHKEIAFIGNTSISPSYQERLEGYKLAIEQNKLSIRPEFIFTSVVEDEEYINKLISDLETLPTAWFCVNDGLTFFVNNALQKRSLRVPQDVSIIGFDNGQLSQIASPKITTMDINLDYFGRRAVQQLLWRMENPDKPIQEILLQTRLLERESTTLSTQSMYQIKEHHTSYQDFNKESK